MRHVRHPWRIGFWGFDTPKYRLLSKITIHRIIFSGADGESKICVVCRYKAKELVTFTSTLMSGILGKQSVPSGRECRRTFRQSSSPSHAKKASSHRGNTVRRYAMSSGENEKLFTNEMVSLSPTRSDPTQCNGIQCKEGSER